MVGALPVSLPYLVASHFSAFPARLLFPSTSPAPQEVPTQTDFSASKPPTAKSFTLPATAPTSEALW